MAIVKRKPENSSLRFQTFLSNDDVTKKKPERALVRGKHKKSGRNTYGRITVRHRGGGAKRKYRLVDFNWSVKDVPGKIVAIEYDPNRSVRIGLVFYKSGVKKYVLMPEGISVFGSYSNRQDSLASFARTCGSVDVLAKARSNARGRRSIASPSI